MKSLELRSCLTCGHEAELHAVVDFGPYRTHDGLLTHDLRLADCACCPCPEWDPDLLSHVSELLGLDVRRVVL